MNIIEQIAHAEKKRRCITPERSKALVEKGKAIRIGQARKLWDELEDIPMDPETERIEQPFHHFPAGTHREDIWHWFEERFKIPVHDLMYR